MNPDNIPQNELNPSPTITAEIDALMNEAHGEKTQEQMQQEADNSPLGLWKAAIVEISPMVKMLHPDLELKKYKTEEGDIIDEAQQLADGLAPALAKHFPNMSGFTLPVELIAAYTAYVVFAPKITVINQKREQAKAEKLKEMNPDAQTSTH